MHSLATADSGKSSILQQVSAAFLRGWVAWIQEWFSLKCQVGVSRWGFAWLTQLWQAAWPQSAQLALQPGSCSMTLLPRWGFLTWFELLLPLVTSLLSPSVGTVAAPGGEMWLFVFFSRVSFGHSVLFLCHSFQKSLFCSKKSPATGLPSISFSPSALCSHRVICNAEHRLILYLICKEHDEINWMWPSVELQKLSCSKF